jgi:hypothetical protein
MQETAEQVTSAHLTWFMLTDDVSRAGRSGAWSWSAWGAETRSCSSLVLMQETAEPVESAHVAWRAVLR